MAKNNLAIKTFPENLFKVAITVATSPPEDKDIVISAMAEVIEKNMVDLTEWIREVEQSIGEQSSM